MYDWLFDYVPKPIKKAVKKSFLKKKNSIISAYDGAKRTSLKDILEKEGEEGQQQEEDIDLTLHEHERVLKRRIQKFCDACCI